MTKELFRVTTIFGGADQTSKFYFDTEEKARFFLSNDGNNIGEIDSLIISSDSPLNYSDGCTWNDLTYGGMIKTKIVLTVSYDV